MSETTTGETSPRHPLSRLLVRTALFALVAGLVAAGYSLTLKNDYRATATLLLAPLPIQQPETDAEEKAAQNPAFAVSFLMVKPLSVLDYRLLLTSDEIVAQLRDELLALKEGSGNDRQSVRIEAVRQAMEVETRIMKQTVYDVVYQPVIELHFTAADPGIAATLANGWAELAVQMAAELSSKKKEGLLDFLEDRFEKKKKELADAEKELEVLDAELDLDALGARISQHEAYITELQLDRSRLASMIAQTEGKLAKLEEQLAVLPQKETLRKAPPDEAYWMLEAQGQQLDSSKVLESEQLNPVYVSLRQQEGVLRAELEGMLKEDVAKEAQLQQVRKETADLRQDRAVHSRMRSKVVREMDTLALQHSQLAVNYGAAQIAEAEDTPDLKLVSHAARPESKTGPHRTLLVLAAAMLGALIAPIHYFVTASLRAHTERAHPARHIAEA